MKSDLGKLGAVIVSLATFALFTLALPQPARGCVGDCSGNNNVTVDELVRGVNIALGITSPADCGAFDSNKDGSVTVDELVSAVNAALSGCQSLDLETIQQQLAQANEISEQIAPAVDSAIDDAARSRVPVDVPTLAAQAATLPGVVSAVSTDSGTVIIVETAGGISFNVLLVDMSDSRLFAQPTPSALRRSQVLMPPSTIMGGRAAARSRCGSRQTPTGHRALILAPFSSQGLGENIESIQRILSDDTGYEVTTFKDADANLARFRGDFVQQYDIVYIETHGFLGNTVDKKLSTILLTGESHGPGIPLSATFHSLNLDQWRTLGSGGVKGAAYLGVSEPWFSLTGATNLRDSFWLTIACESALIDDGPTSLSAELFRLGAGAHVGFDEPVSTPLARAMAETALDLMADGLDLAYASDITRADPDVGLLGSILLVAGTAVELPTAYPSLFDDSQRISGVPYVITPLCPSATPTPTFTSTPQHTGTPTRTPTRVPTQTATRTPPPALTRTSTSSPTRTSTSPATVTPAAGSGVEVDFITVESVSNVDKAGRCALRVGIRSAPEAGFGGWIGFLLTYNAYDDRGTWIGFAQADGAIKAASTKTLDTDWRPLEGNEILCSQIARFELDRSSSLASNCY